MKIFFIFIILSQIINCGEKPLSDEFPILYFRENDSLVSQKINYDKISLAIPSNLEKVVGDKYNRIVNAIEVMDGSYFKNNILSIYQSQGGMVCIISKINDENLIYEKLDERFESDLAKSFDSKEIIRGQFLVNGLETVQFISTKNKIVNYKLYIDVIKKECFQIDYFAPTINFVNFQKAIEASISTIKIKG